MVIKKNTQNHNNQEKHQDYEVLEVHTRPWWS
jgi:hypothetical protein